MGKLNQKHLDILAFGAHPDDVEVGAGGLLVKAKQAGLKTGVVDLSQGEMSSRGDKKTRIKETKRSSKILKLDQRICLNLPDTNIINSIKVQKEIIKLIRRFKPETILIPYGEDSHPDHVNTNKIVTEGIFRSELSKFLPDFTPHRPKVILYYQLNQEFTPSFILDISLEAELKFQALAAHNSQLIKATNPNDSYYNKPETLEYWQNRATYYGSKIGTAFGEPYKTSQILGLKNLNHLLQNNF